MAFWFVLVRFNELVGFLVRKMGAKVPAAASEKHPVTRQTLICVWLALCVMKGPQQDQLILASRVFVSGPDFYSPL